MNIWHFLKLRPLQIQFCVSFFSLFCVSCSQDKQHRNHETFFSPRFHHFNQHTNSSLCAVNVPSPLNTQCLYFWLVFFVFLPFSLNFFYFSFVLLYPQAAFIPNLTAFHLCKAQVRQVQIRNPQLWEPLTHFISLSVVTLLFLCVRGSRSMFPLNCWHGLCSQKLCVAHTHTQI